MSQKKMKWTKTHRLEALRRTVELAALILGGELGGDDPITDAHHICIHGSTAVVTEQRWRDALTFAFEPARIDSEVRRVDRLARGVVVRVVIWRVYFEDGSCHQKTEEQARVELASARSFGRHVRIARARCLRYMSTNRGGGSPRG